MKSFALYLHIPFCQRRCTYCDFNTYVGLGHQREPYVHALCREIALQGAWLQEESHVPPAHSIFLGGGTPTTLSAEQVARIVDTCAASFALQECTEVTMEANPALVNRDYLVSLRQAGINRISLGVQSFADHELALLGRLHNSETAQRTLVDARLAGFENISLDLMYGLPLQDIQGWQNTLSTALKLRPEHLSLYALGLEKGTPLYRAISAGHLPALDPDLAADMYELAGEILAQAGYVHYEISNWARTGMQLAARHNLTYWRNEPYWGFGAGAHSWIAGVRFANVLHPLDYIRHLEPASLPDRKGGLPCSPAVQSESIEHITPELEMAETMILGLRLVTEGVQNERFMARFGRSFWEEYGEILSDLFALGLLEGNVGRVRLSRRGQLLGNEVFQRFLPDPGSVLSP